MPLKAIAGCKQKVAQCIEMNGWQPDMIESTRLLAKILFKTFQIRKEFSINIRTILSKIGRTHFELGSSAKTYAAHKSIGADDNNTNVFLCFQREYFNN